MNTILRLKSKIAKSEQEKKTLEREIEKLEQIPEQIREIIISVSDYKEKAVNLVQWNHDSKIDEIIVDFGYNCGLGTDMTKKINELGWMPIGCIFYWLHTPIHKIEREYQIRVFFGKLPQE